jgi:hydrogenase maturation protein HypF
VPTSSMGRLFDAVASLTGVCQSVEYEAEAAIRLEGLARFAPARPYRFSIAGDVADPGPVLRAIADDVRAGEDVGEIAAGFHAAVAVLIADLADRCRDETGLDVVALGGGVFQNALLISAARDALAERGFTVLRPRLLPPNDGGIALGQLIVAASE